MQRNSKILIVDDDQVFGIMLKTILEYKGFTVILLGRGEKTEETLYKNNVDLVILDMLLSGIKGIDICASLKSNKNTAHLPVIMMSALADYEDICLAAGADDFISKLFDMESLISRINNLIKRSDNISADGNLERQPGLNS